MIDLPPIASTSLIVVTVVSGVLRIAFPLMPLTLNVFFFAGVLSELVPLIVPTGAVFQFQAISLTPLTLIFLSARIANFFVLDKYVIIKKKEWS